MAAETNQAYRDGGVNQRIELVAVEEVRYRESWVWSDVYSLQDPSDGHMDELHATRDQVAADIVMLIRSGFGGYAYGILTPSNASAADAFAVSGVSSGSDVFAHELGSARQTGGGRPVKVRRKGRCNRPPSPRVMRRSL